MHCANEFNLRRTVNTNQPIPSNIIFDIFGVLFQWDPMHSQHSENGQFTPIHENIALIQECANLANDQGEPLHRLFILSNCKLDLLEQLYTAYPAVFDPFEGIVIPNNSGFAKPDKRMFEHLLQTHNLHPSNSFFIDDSPENTQSAITLGITGITYGPGVNVKRTLISHGVIPYTHV